MNMKATQSVSAWESVCPVAIIIVIMNFIKRRTRLYTGQKKREKGVIFLQNKAEKLCQSIVLCLRERLPKRWR